MCEPNQVIIWLMHVWFLLTGVSNNSCRLGAVNLCRHWWWPVQWHKFCWLPWKVCWWPSDRRYTFVLSCMHPPVQPKSLSWWGEVGNSLIFQHSPSRGGSLRPQTWNRSEQQLFHLIALTRIRTRDLWLWYHIELHAPTSSTQKLKLMGRGGQFTYIPIVWHACSRYI